MNDEQFDALVNLIASFSGHGDAQARQRAMEEARQMLVPRCQTKPSDMIGG